MHYTPYIKVVDVEFVSKDWWIIFLNCLKEFENENMIVFYLYADMPHDSNQQLVFFKLTVFIWLINSQRDIDEIPVYPRIKTICDSWRKFADVSVSFVMQLSPLPLL